MSSKLGFLENPQQKVMTQFMVVRELQGAVTNPELYMKLPKTVIKQ